MSQKDELAIKVSHVSKSFKLPHEKSNSVKSIVVNPLKKRTYERQEVLKDINFEIKKGEFFGIVGRNGSGKSTLLKLLAGIYSPDKGYIQVNGKLTPFIELGVGFNPELTGRENVFLNGALLGFNRKEMSTMYDEIVEFAELEKFMDQKLKNYSSGMQVRLAFSIAIRAKSDILILDEVLAVGDEAFQRKCLDVFEKYKADKQTVILVTHDMEMVNRFCSNAILINDGRLVASGKTEDAINGYKGLNREATDKNLTKQIIPPSDLKIILTDEKGKRKRRFEYGDIFSVELSWPSHKSVSDAGVAISTSTGQVVYATNTFLDKKKVSGNKIICAFKLLLGEGKYHIIAGTFKDRPEHQVDFITKGPSFFVNPETKILGEGVIRLEHEWLKGKNNA